MAEFQVLDVAALRNAAVAREPYSYLLGDGVLRENALGDLRRDFPGIKKAGYLTLDEVQLNGAFRTLVEELESDEVAQVVGGMLGLDLTPYPRLLTVMGHSKKRHGRPHTDGKSKLATMLVYMNDDWNDEGPGRLRVLYNEKGFEPYAAEVPPTMGSVFAFLRCDDSWHGHEPFVGERRVVQMAWVASENELNRKKKRNKLAQFWKGIAGR